MKATHWDEIRALGPCHIDEEEIGWGSKGFFLVFLGAVGACTHAHTQTRKQAYALTQQSKTPIPPSVAEGKFVC